MQINDRFEETTFVCEKVRLEPQIVWICLWNSCGNPVEEARLGVE